MEITEAVKKFGTPLYVYDVRKITERYRDLKTFLPESFEIYYALKANGNLAICRHLSGLGCGADISSYGELATALKAGFDARSILFTGPSKSDHEIGAAIRHRVGLIVIESLAEARRVNTHAGVAGITQDVILRINPARQSGGGLEISGHVSKFGVDEERAAGVLKAMRELERLRCAGIHVYTQSNVLEHRVLLENHTQTVALANRLQEEGHAITLVDFGGGIGVPYSPSESSFDVRAFGDGLASLVEKNPYRYRYAMEVGRYFVSESGVYVSRIIEIRRSRGKTFLMIDGGIHQLYRPLMRRANKYLEVVGKQSSAPSQVVSIAGPLATPEDVLVEDVRIPEAEAGDLLLIRNCGAYTFSHSLLYFSLHPLPAEVAYEDGEFHLIRRRGSVEDFFLNQDERV